MVGRWGWGQRLGLQASPIPVSAGKTPLLCLACRGFTLKLSFEDKCQTTILRFDLRPASTGSILALYVGMAVAFQYKVSLFWNLGLRPRHKHLLTHKHIHMHLMVL